MRERIQRPTATRVLARLEEAGLVERTADPTDRRSSLVIDDRTHGKALLSAIRDRKDAYLARAARPAVRRRARRARPRRGHPRAGARRVRVSAAVARTFSSLSVPNYRRYFGGQIVSITGNWMQIVGEMWLMVKLTGSGVVRRAHRRPPVPARSCCSAPTAGCSPTGCPSARC